MPEFVLAFQHDLKALAPQLHAAIVVEGLPLKQVAEADDPTLAVTDEAAAESLGNTPSAALVRLTRQYDYSVSKTRSGVYLLKKRYSNPYDIPGVTLEEYRLALEDVQALLKPYQPNPTVKSPNSFFQEFFPSVTEQQRQTMLDGDGTLPLSALTSWQQNQLWRMTLYMYADVSLQAL